MNKEFIPYEQALELKELGFNEECMAYWTSSLNGYHIEYKHYINKHWMFTANDNKNRDKMCTAPLYQQAFRWFREKYGLYSEIFVDDNKTFGFYITSFIEEGRLDKPITRQFNTYEEAELGCVKQLIEIIDRKAEAYS